MQHTPKEDRELQRYHVFTPRARGKETVHGPTMSSLLKDLNWDDLIHHTYRLFHENPLHVVIEVCLAILIIVLLLQKAYKPRHRPDKLTPKVPTVCCIDYLFVSGSGSAGTGVAA